MPEPALLFPLRPLHPLRALVRRVGLALGILLLVALVTWLGCDGYRDADGGPVTVLDAVYYASVTVTTTGYGDITPISPGARAITAFVVTPARILFLIVLVGTTLELLTERFRHTVATTRWRRRVRRHTIIAGYGTKGRAALASLLASGSERAAVVVVDTAAGAVEAARQDGLTSIRGDATRTEVLRQARIDVAAGVVVTCNRDDTATLITLTARELNPNVTIVAAVREEENAHLLRQSGASTVIVSAEAAGRLLGLATGQPFAVSVLEDLIVAGQGIELLERGPHPDELGRSPRAEVGRLPVALVRGGRRISFGEAGYEQVEPGDVVVCLCNQS